MFTTKLFTSNIRQLSVMGVLTMLLLNTQLYGQCPVPTGLSVTSVTNSNAKVSWTAVSGVVATYSWWISNSSGSQTLASGTTAGSFVNATNLPASTECKAYIQTLCSSPSGTSAAIGPVSFTTGCAPLGLPFSENLTNVSSPNLPTCWTSADLNNNGAGWQTQNNAFHISKFGMNDWLWTGGLSLEAGVPYEISFSYSGNAANAAALSLRWGTSPTAIDMNATALASISLSTQSGNSVSTFTPATTGTYYLGWLAFRQNNANALGITIDNIQVRPQGCIAAPAPLGMTSINATSATANWSNVAGTTGYDWKVVLAGSGSGASAIQEGNVIGAATTVTVTGLSSGINYDFYVSGKCGSSNNSNWSAPQSFTTTLSAILTGTINNDAFIQVNWSLPVDNCLLNGLGQPYPQGVHLDLKDGSGQVIHQVDAADLSQYVGTQQPIFGAVAQGNMGTGYAVTNTNLWGSVSYWTIETWTLNNTGMANAKIFSDNSTTTNSLFFVNAQQLAISVNNVTSLFPTVIPAGVWTHIAVTYNGNEAKLYVNGTYQSSVSVSGFTLNGINGGSSVMANYNFGNMGELRLWDRVRTAIEVKNDRFLTSFIGISQTNLRLHVKWNSVGANVAATDYATTYDNLDNTSSTTGINAIAYTTTPNYTPLVGSFQHYVGPGQSKSYTLNAYQIGSAAPTVNCSALTATGSTTAFQPPIQMTASDNQLNKITLSWKNKSKLSESFKIYRNGTLRAVIAGTTEIDSVLTFEDVYTEGDSSSIVSGNVYQYCIETYSNTLQYTSPTQVCDSGRTVNLNFAATDNAFPNKVNLSWNNVGLYGYSVQILRETSTIATLSAQTTSYSDDSPIYGKNASYTLALTNPTTGATVITAKTTGSVAARGAISGRVITNEGEYAIRGARVYLKSLLDTTFRDTAISDINGNYAFSGLFYDIDATFEVRAVYGNHVFYDNKRKINLTDALFAKIGADFRDSLGFAISNTPLPISNFALAAVSLNNRVNLSWQYTSVANDTTIFDIYRENKLIASVSNVSNGLAANYNYADLTGVPNANYIYKLVGYRLQNGTIFTKTEKDTIVFPLVHSLVSLAAAPNATLGTVNLTWVNNSTNYTGYNLYRNNILISNPTVGATTYIDDAATSGVAATYTLKNRREVEGVTYESTGVNANAVSPALPTISSLGSSVSTTRHSATLSWTAPASLQNVNYNFDGYRVYRNGTLIGILPKGIVNYTFEDKTAQPSASATYTVRVYAILTDSTYAQSAAATRTLTFPGILVASAPSATKTGAAPRVGEIRVRWTPATNNAAVRNIDGQMLIATIGAVNDTVFLNSKETFYRYFTNNPANYTFTIRSFRIANGIKYYSTAVSVVGNALAGSTNPPLPTQFKASQDLSNQVRLSWDYPNFALSTFNIYRDSLLIATLPTTTRSYQDTSASNFFRHLYQIEAVYGANTAQRVAASGRERSLYTLTGRIYSQNAQYGLAGIDVYVTASEFFARAKTDSTGFYQISVPAQPAVTYTVMADAFNNALTQTFAPYVAGSLAGVQTFVTNAQDEKYQVNFASSNSPLPLNAATPAKVKYFMASADPAQRRVGITWRLSNNDYEGVEVYRANVLLATVAQGDPFMVWDNQGAPGISYVYQIRSFKTVSNQKVYSEFAGYETTFPALEAPRHAIAQIQANGVHIEWAHTWDNHTGYIIERNGSPVATLPIKGALVYEDFNGLPNQQYVYLIRAYLQLNNTFYYSEPTELQVTFPDISEVSNLNVSIPTQTITGLVFANTCSNNTTRTQNHVSLTWTYPSNNADGYLVYRDDEIIATLPKDTMYYKDYVAIPDVQYTYKVQAIKKNNGITYNSLGVKSNPTLFPSISAAYNLTTKDTLGMIRYTWLYPEQGVKGFLVKIKVGANIIDEDTISASAIENGKFTYWHKDGTPGEAYAYQVQAYSVRNGVTYYAINSQCAQNANPAGYDWASIVYPIPVAPITVAATDGTYDSYVQVTWAYSSLAEVSGFEIYRNNIKVGETDKGARSFNDLVFTSATPYTVKAYRLVGATRYFSAASAADNGHSKPLQTSLTPPNGTLYGFSLDSYENSLLVGAPGSASAAATGYLQHYYMDAQSNMQTGWSYSDVESAGYSVALSNDMAIDAGPFHTVAANWVGKYANNVLTYSNRFNNGFGAASSSTAISDLSISTNSFGIINTHPIIYGIPNDDGAGTDAGGAYIDVYGNSATSFSGNVVGGRFGFAASANQRHAVISRPYTSSFGLFEYYLDDPSNGTSWTYKGQLPNPSGINSGPLLGFTLGYASNYELIAGAPLDNGGGKAYVYHRNNTTGAALDPNTWTAPIAIPNPNTSSPSNDRFGMGVDMRDDLALVSAPGFSSGKGIAYLFQKNSNNQWDTIRTFRFTGTVANNDSLGRSVKIGKHHIYLGAPGTNGNQGKVYIEPIGEVGTVTATKGSISAQTRVDWTFVGVQDEIAGFRIYRDGILVGSTPKSDRFFFDATGIPGKRYIYEVAVYHSDIEQRRYPSEGWSKPNGLLEGQVSTLQGGGKVGGVLIEATSQIEGSYFNYSATSDGNGNYSIPEVYYGGATANYSLKATFKDHEFVENPLNTQLSNGQPTRTYLNFIDKTAFIIGGNVSGKATTCGLDSIKLIAYYQFTDGSLDTLPAVYTNASGDYSITVDPYRANLYAIKVGIENSRQVNLNDKIETRQYKFAAQSASTLIVTPNFSESNTLNFLDTLTYPVYLSIINACQAPILGGQYQIRVKDEKGCYNQTFITNNNGYVIANLPPINVNINIEGVNNLNQQTELVVNYLRYRPQILNLYDLHLDTLVNAGVNYRDSVTKRSFTYYTPPIISVAAGFNRYLCNDPTKAAIVTENKNYKLNFAVQSNYNGVLCNAKVGHIIINNAAAITKIDTLDFDAETQLFQQYSFNGGTPNLVSPHQYTMVVNYYSPEYELLASKNWAVLVEGISSLPGSDIIVDLGAADQIKLPMFVLRDPPGDASYSTLEEGVSVNYTFDASTERALTLGLHAQAAFGTAAGGFRFEADLNFIHVNGTEVLSSVTVTNTQAISTSADELHVGKEGDIIIGSGLALQYGLAQQIKVDSLTGCIVKKTTTLSFTPNSLQTTWMYSTAHIENLIKGYEIQITQVKAGTLVLKTKDGSNFTKPAAEAKLQTYIDGWKKVLRYHQKETLPWYDLCAHDVPKYLNDLPQRKALVQKWQDKYCLDTKYVKGGSYKADASKNTGRSFNIPDASFEELSWTDDRIFAYNVARAAIYHLEYVFPSGETGKYDNFYNYNDRKELNPQWFLSGWQYKENALSSASVGQSYLNKANEVGILAGTAAKNITFSSGVAYEETQENNQVMSTAYSDNYFIEREAKIGFYIGTEGNAGFGFSIKLFEADNWVALNLAYNYSETSRYEYGTDKFTNSSFHLEDNDPSDQFSVTCIKGVNPHHTPYFVLLGGRSSCPYEAGTIARDNPKVFVYDVATQSVAKEQTLYNQNPNDPAIFTLQLSNNSPFNEPREVVLYQELSPNTENAEVRASGQEISYDGIPYLIYPNQPILVELSVGKGQDYDVKGLIIGVKSNCDLPPNFVQIPTEYVTLNAFFQSPCSGITLLTPEPAWQIKRRNPFDANSRESLLIKMADYDTDNENLKSARLEYRRMGGNQVWQSISGSEASKDSLANWNALNFLPGALKYYPFIWDISDNYVGFPDGEYEVRAVAECETKGQMYSQVIKGSIYRNTTTLGLPEPADKVWTNADEISVSYIHDVDCALGSSFTVKSLANGDTLTGNVLCHNNKLLFQPTSNMKNYDGDSLKMWVNGVTDKQGNKMDSVVWTFKVVAADLYAANDWIEVLIEQGDKKDISTFLVNNTTDGQPLTYAISNLNTYSTWLSTKMASGTVLKGMNEEIVFNIDAATMPIDTIEALLNVTANGQNYPSLIKLRVRVVAKSPNWTFNPNLYEQNMSLISNFNFNNTGIKSQDTADIISVWIDNQLRGVGNISKISSTIYNGMISVYGNAADAGKTLNFRVWDASTGTEYDARPDANAVFTFTANSIKGSLSNPALLDVLTATDKARYIPLNQGWTMFSVNAQNWNRPVNTALASLKYKQSGDVIKTANKSASYSGATWTSANGMDSTNVHKGYQIYLQHADTLRVSGASAIIKPIAISQGWNLVGYPLQGDTAIQTAMTFLGTPDTMWLKTVAQNPTYSQNMIANYYAGTWKYAFNSNMQQLRPNFAYWLKVNTAGSQLKYPGVTVATPVTLLRVNNNGANAHPEKPETWGVNPANYEHNMLINAIVQIDKQAIQDTSSLVAAFVDGECRGVGKLTYLPELNKHLMSMFVYSNGGISTSLNEPEKVSFRIFAATPNRVYNHYETLDFETDAIIGDFDNSYKFSNVAPDNTFFVSAYPNPFETLIEVDIQTDKAQSFKLSLTDIAGRVLMQDKITESTTNGKLTFDTSKLKLASGVYFLQVVGSLGETTTVKLMK